MPQKMNGLLQTYISEIKKYTVHIYRRLFCMVPMQEEISDQTQT